MKRALAILALVASLPALAQSEQDRESISLKKVAGVDHRLATNAVFEEPAGGGVNMSASGVWVQSINATPATCVSDGVCQAYTLQVLTADAAIPSNKGFCANSAGTSCITGTRLRGWVPPKYGQGYTIKVYSNTDVELTPTTGTPSATQYRGFWDYETGYLALEVNPATAGTSIPLKVTGYRYVGNTLATYLLTTPADALSATTSSASGLEIIAGKLTMLQGCSDGQILKWVESSDTWGCAADSTGAGAALTVEEADGAPTDNAVTLIQFDQADGYVVTDEGTGLIQIDHANPSDCGANTWATTIAANGDLTCSAISGGAGITDATVAEADLASEDYGDFTCGGSADDCVLDTDSVGAAEIAAGAVGTSEAAGLDIGDDTNLAAGAGLLLTGDSLSTASTEAAFLTDGGSSDVTCGSSNQGKMQVMDDGALTYCDGATTSLLVRIPREQCKTWVVEHLAGDDDGLFVPLDLPYAVTLTNAWCKCKGTCTTLADISFHQIPSDGTGTPVNVDDPGTDEWVDCTAHTANQDVEPLGADNTVPAYDGLFMDVDNAVSPESDSYSITICWTVD